MSGAGTVGMDTAALRDLAARLRGARGELSNVHAEVATALSVVGHADPSAGSIATVDQWLDHQARDLLRRADATNAIDAAGRAHGWSSPAFARALHKFGQVFTRTEQRELAGRALGVALMQVNDIDKHPQRYQRLLDRLQRHAHDVDFCAGVFAALPAHATVTVIWALLDGHRIAPPSTIDAVRTLSTAFGTAQRSGALGREFIEKLLDDTRVGGVARLLQYGEFSATFLARAAPRLIDVVPTDAQPLGSYYDEVFLVATVMLQALARNKEAALAYFADPRSLAILIEREQSQGDVGRDLCAALLAATTWKHDSKHGNDAVASVFNATARENVPQSLLPTFAHIIATHMSELQIASQLAEFDPADTIKGELRLSYDVALSALSTLMADRQSAATLLQAFFNFTGSTLMDHGIETTLSGYRQIGNLLALLNTAERRALIDEAREAAARTAMWRGVFNTLMSVTAFIPGHQGVKFVGRIAIDELLSLAHNTDPEDAARAADDQGRARAVLLKQQLFIAFFNAGLIPSGDQADPRVFAAAQIGDRRFMDEPLLFVGATGQIVPLNALPRQQQPLAAAQQDMWIAEAKLPDVLQARIDAITDSIS